MNVFVDTSTLIALLDEDDARHFEASATFRSLVATAELVTHNYIQVEALAVASRRLGVEAAHRLAEALFPVMRTIWVDESIHRAALAALRTSGPTASLVDHVSFEVMRQNGIDVCFAFDPDFGAQGFRQAVAVKAEKGRGVGEAGAAYAGSASPSGDLVSVAEISARAGRPVNTVQSWRRRYADFPVPVVQLAAGPIWSWPQIAEWISGRPLRRVASNARAGHRPRVSVLDLAGAAVGMAGKIPATAEAIDDVIAAGQAEHAAARKQALSGYTHRRHTGRRAGRRTDGRR